jgi:hypothetical protein
VKGHNSEEAQLLPSAVIYSAIVVTGAYDREVFLLVETRMGPGFSGNSSAESLVLSWILTCVFDAEGALVTVVVAMMFAARYAALLLDSKVVFWTFFLHYWNHLELTPRDIMHGNEARFYLSPLYSPCFTLNPSILPLVSTD